jgi:hypothetical protein
MERILEQLLMEEKQESHLPLGLIQCMEEIIHEQSLH